MSGLFTVASGIAMFMPEILNKLSLVNERHRNGWKMCEAYEVKLSGDSNEIVSKNVKIWE